MGDTFCSLCGVPFGLSSDIEDDIMSVDDLSWTEEFCALVQSVNGGQDTIDVDQTEKSSIWRLTGNGRGMPYDKIFKPPPLYVPQSDWEYGSNGIDTTDEESVIAFKAQEGLPNYAVAYPMHPPCLEILKQQYFQHARGTSFDTNILGRIISSQPLDESVSGLKPDWSDGGYLGAEQFWQDGSDWMDEPPLEDEYPDMETMITYHFLDPGGVKGLDMLLRDPPRAGTSRYSDAVTLAGATPATDCFMRLPQELRSIILCYLPASDVTSARLASRAMGSVPLSESYWHSRFDFPFELSHLDWESSWISGSTEAALIDWPAFCSSLLHTDENERDFGWRRNRNRISSLMKGLAFRILQDQGLIVDTEEEGIASNVVCHHELSVASTAPSHSTDIIFALDLPLGEIQKISIAFKHTQEMDLVCGISFHGTSGVKKLGQCKTKNVQTAILEDGSTFSGFILAMNPKGIIGVQVLVSTEQGVSALEPALGSLMDEWKPFGLGKIAAVDGSELYGLRITTSKMQNIIVSVGLLEPIDNPEESSSKQATLPHFEILWQPSVPPSHLFVTQISGMKECHDFQYSQQMIFAESSNILKPLSRVTAFFDLSPPGLTGIQYHFDNASSLPPEPPFRGKSVEFFIDGPGGEVICGVDVFWGDEEQCLGVSFVTSKGRRSPFNQTLINGDVRVERQVPPDDMVMTGMYMRMIHDDRNLACCNGVGILCAKKEGTIPAPEPLPLEVSQAHDDHFNIWTGDSPPPTDAIFGEIVGCQPNHGFANWISFNQPITNVTACLGSHATNQTSKDSLAGLRFKIENSLPLMLGRHTSPGHEFSLAKDDKISEVTIALTVSKSKTPQIIGINFKTEKGLSSEANIFGEHIPKLAEPQKQTVSLKSTPSLLLVGMIWSYDLGPLRPAWHGIQPLYKLRDTDTPGTPQLQQALYPSLPWINSPPPHLQLRPIPAPQSNITAFESSVSSADNVDQTGDIASITVFFNAFLQGIELSYHGGRKEAVGNLIGQFQRIELEKGEEIASIEIHERERRIFVNAANAREVVCVEGIKFTLTKRQNGKNHTRSASYCGPAPDRPFGPFLHRQGGLWNAASNDSADWESCYKLQVHNIAFEDGEVFEGLYAETLPTLIRRLGVLVSRKPTHGNEASQPHPARANSLLTAEISNNNDTSETPWLGTLPPPTLNPLPLPLPLPPFLPTQAIYRLWCPIPPSLTSYTIYRQLIYTPTAQHFVIGIEFHSLRPGGNTLLGFRSMKEEEIEAVSVEGEVVGVAAREVEEGEVRGLVGVEFLTSAIAREREEVVVVAAPKRLRGVYAVFGERIHAVGILQE